jgi:hypothetical protein
VTRQQRSVVAVVGAICCHGCAGWSECTGCRFLGRAWIEVGRVAERAPATLGPQQPPKRPVRMGCTFSTTTASLPQQRAGCRVASDYGQPWAMEAVVECAVRAGMLLCRRRAEVVVHGEHEGLYLVFLFYCTWALSSHSEDQWLRGAPIDHVQCQHHPHHHHLSSSLTQLHGHATFLLTANSRE